jgi:hypothetical protein
MMTTANRLVRADQQLVAGVDPRDPEEGVRLVEDVARCAVEIVRDSRPVSTLSRLVTPEVSAYLARRASLTRRIRGLTGRSARVRLAISGVRTCVVTPQVVEASAVVRETDRARFLAMRWELRHTGWRVTVLEVG